MPTLRQSLRRLELSCTVSGMAQTQAGQFHVVRSYEDDKSLCLIVSGFIADGLALGQPALIIATDRKSVV